MRNIILVSHGELAKGMAYSVQMILGKADNLYCYGLMPGGLVDNIMKEIRIKSEADSQNQYIVISDIFGGSVCNGSFSLQDIKNVKLATGMNLPMIVELLLAKEDISTEDFYKVVSASKENIKVLPNIKDEISGENDFFS